MKNKKLLSILLISFVAVIMLMGWHSQFNYHVTPPITIPRVRPCPLDSAFIISTLPEGISIRELAEDNIFSELRTRKPEVVSSGPPPVPPPEYLDIKLRGLSKIGGKLGALLEVGSGTKVNSPSPARPSSRGSFGGRSSNEATRRNELSNKVVTNATGFIASRLYRQGDPIPVTATDSALLKEISPNGEKKIVVMFMNKEYVIDLKYDYALLQSKMELEKKSSDAEFAKKVKATESALADMKKTPEEREQEENMRKHIERRQRIDQEMRERAHANAQRDEHGRLK